MLSHTTISKIFLGICTQGKVIEQEVGKYLSTLGHVTQRLNGPQTSKPIHIGATKSLRILDKHVFVNKYVLKYNQVFKYKYVFLCKYLLCISMHLYINMYLYINTYLYILSKNEVR